MQLWMLGTNHEHAAIDTRARLAFTDDTLSDGLRELSTIAHEGVILSTCNRTELYALMDDDPSNGSQLQDLLASIHDIPRQIIEDITYLNEDEDAARHLYRVACGLDSMMLGEPQILGQIQSALSDAQRAYASGPVLTRLFTEALRTGKLARATTGIARNRRSIAHAAVDLARAELAARAGGQAVVIGAGEIATLTAKVLRTAKLAPITIVNRDAARGRALADTVEGQYVPLTALEQTVADAAVVFCAVTTPQYLMHQGHLAHLSVQRDTPLVAIDLGVPRGIAPDVGTHPLVRLFTIDDVEAIAAESRLHYAHEINKTETIIEQRVSAFLDWWQIRDVTPTIHALQARAETIRQSEVERALRKLGHLNARDRNVIEALSVAITGKFLHTPIISMRDAARAGTADDLIGSAAALFDLAPTDVRSSP